MEHNDIFFQKNTVTKEELLKHCKISKTSDRDFFQMTAALYYNMGVEDPFMAVEQILNSNINMNESIKLYDERDGLIYGLLLLGEKNIEKSSPLYSIDLKACAAFEDCTQVNGFLFIIDSRLRGTGLDKKMIEEAKPYLTKFDMIWAGVEQKLRTHNYWQRMGLEKFFEIPEAKFYVRFNNNDAFVKFYHTYLKNAHS